MKGVGGGVLGGVILVALLLGHAAGDHTKLCINFPGIRYRKGMESMGLDKFPQEIYSDTSKTWEPFWKSWQESVTYGTLDVSGQGEVSKRYAQFEDSPNSGTLKIFKIKYTKHNQLVDRDMANWFRVQFTVNAGGSADVSKRKLIGEVLKWVVIWVRDDSARRQNIGEFVWNFPTPPGGKPKCPKSSATKYMVITCGGASRSEPLVSNVIVWVRNNTKLNKDYFSFPPESNDVVVSPDISTPQELNFYVRIPIQDCNQKKLVVFRARFEFDYKVLGVREGDQSLIRQATAWYEFGPKTYNTEGKGHYIPGGSDALPAPFNVKDMDCGEEITAKNPLWYFLTLGNFGSCEGSSGSASCIYMNYPQFGYPVLPFRPDDQKKALFGCQGHFFHGRCPRNYNDMVNEYIGSLNSEEKMFYYKNQNQAQENTVPICEHEPLKYRDPGGHGVGFRPYYVTPKMFNNKTVKFWKTHDYLKMINQTCEPIFNGDPTCNITMMNSTYNWTKVVTLQPTPAPSSSNRRSHSEQQYSAQQGFQAWVKEGDYDEDGLVKVDFYRNYSGNLRDSNIDRIRGVGFGVGKKSNETGFVKLIWGLRKAHGTIMGWAFFLVIPLNHFIARYFKESFMDTRILYSRVWYTVHVHSIFVTMCLLASGTILMIFCRNYMGTSLVWEARLHRGLGYLGMAIFVLVSAVGGLRGFYDPLRKITIGFHWFMGNIFYLCMAGAMLTSVFIPSSGITKSSEDRSTRWKSREDNVLDNWAFWLVIAWVLMEVIFHVLMMSNTFAFDRKMVIVKRRIYFPVLIPVIKEHSSVNASGHALRVICLCVYGFLAACCTGFFNILIMQTELHQDMGLGPMTCTHDKESENLTILHKFSPNCQ